MHMFHLYHAGHTLGTSLFSPPPSTGNQHGLFINSPTSSGKVGYTSTHPPVGSSGAAIVTLIGC